MLCQIVILWNPKNAKCKLKKSQYTSVQEARVTISDLMKVIILVDERIRYSKHIYLKIKDEYIKQWSMRLIAKFTHRYR